MENEKNTPKQKDTEITKQNIDLPNIPATSEKVENEEKLKSEIQKSSHLNEDGKTDNTEQNSGN